MAPFIITYPSFHSVSHSAIREQDTQVFKQNSLVLLVKVGPSNGVLIEAVVATEDLEGVGGGFDVVVEHRNRVVGKLAY